MSSKRSMYLKNESLKVLQTYSRTQNKIRLKSTNVTAVRVYFKSKIEPEKRIEELKCTRISCGGSNFPSRLVWFTFTYPTRQLVTFDLRLVYFCGAVN